MELARYHSCGGQRNPGTAFGNLRCPYGSGKKNMPCSWKGLKSLPRFTWQAFIFTTALASAMSMCLPVNSTWVVHPGLGLFSWNHVSVCSQRLVCTIKYLVSLPSGTLEKPFISELAPRGWYEDRNLHPWQITHCIKREKMV